MGSGAMMRTYPRQPHTSYDVYEMADCRMVTSPRHGNDGIRQRFSAARPVRQQIQKWQ